MSRVRAQIAWIVVLGSLIAAWQAWVRVRGVARVVPDGDPAVTFALDLLAAKYPQYRAVPPAGPVLEITAGAIRWWAGSAE